MTSLIKNKIVKETESCTAFSAKTGTACKLSCFTHLTRCDRLWYSEYRFDSESINIGQKMANQNISIENLPDLLTVREVAELLRVSPLTIKRWGKRGKLPAIRINSRGDRRYKKEAVLYLLGIQQKGM